MAAQTRVYQQAEDLGTLRELLDLAKDPKKIIAAHEEARKQIALTDEEARKAAEAKDFIAKYNELQKDIKAREDKLAADIAANEKNKADSDIVFKTESDRLAGIAKAQLETKKAQDAEATALADAQKTLAAERKAFETASATANKALADKAAADDKLRVVNEVEAARLAEVKAKWLAKAEKFKEAEAI